MRRIFFIAPASLDQPRGISIYVLELIKMLLKQNECKIGLLSSSPCAKSLITCADLNGCFIMEGPAKYHWNPWFLDSCWLDRIEKEFGRPDIVHFHDTYCPFQTALAMQMFHKGWKYIVSPHGGLQEGHQRRKFIKKTLGNIFFLNSFLKKSAAVHVLNGNEELSLRRKFPKIKTFILPNGVPVDMLLMLEPLLALKASSSHAPLRFGFIGRLDIKNKGIDILLNAIKLLQEQYPDILMEFVFVGYFCTNKDKIVFQNLVSKLKDPAKIIHTGSLEGEEKLKILASFDVFVYPSRYEGMPAAVIEAMAFGKPCLITPGTNMQDIIKECEGGWVAQDNVNSIANGLIQIARSKQDISRLGNNAQEYVKKHLTWDIIACDYIKEIKNLAK